MSSVIGRRRPLLVSVLVALAFAGSACSSAGSEDASSTSDPTADASTTAPPETTEPTDADPEPEPEGDLPAAVLDIASASPGKVIVDQRIDGEHYLSQDWRYADGPVLTVAITSPSEDLGVEILMAYREDSAFFHVPPGDDNLPGCSGWLGLPYDDLSQLGTFDVAHLNEGLAPPTAPFLEALGPVTDRRVVGDEIVWQSTVPGSLGLSRKALASLDDEQLDEVDRVDLPVELRLAADESSFTLVVEEMAVYDHLAEVGVIEAGSLSSASRTLRHERWSGAVGDDIPATAASYLDCVEASEG